MNNTRKAKEKIETNLGFCKILQTQHLLMWFLLKVYPTYYKHQIWRFASLSVIKEGGRNRRGPSFLHILSGGWAVNLKLEVQRATKGAFGRNWGVSFNRGFIVLRLTTTFIVMRCTIWYHLYNFNNVKNIHGECYF